MKKVHFGCFNLPLDGWINVDFIWKHLFVSKIPFLPHILYKLGFLRKHIYEDHKKGTFKKIVFGDVRKKLKFKDNSVDAIFTTHMAEHLYKEEVVFFLKECYRIMKLGAILRIEVPDFKFYLKDYISRLRGKKKYEAMNCLCANLYEPNEKDQPVGHKYMFDEHNLIYYLELMGFKNCKRQDYLKGEIPDVDKMIKKEGNLIVECVK